MPQNIDGVEEMRLLEPDEEAECSQKEDEEDNKHGRTTKKGAFPLSIIWTNVISRIGLLYGILFGISVGLQMCLVKLISSVSAYQTMFYRSIMFLLPLVSVSWKKGNSYNTRDMIYYLAYGLSNSVGITLLYAALSLAHVGNVSAISTNGPLPTAILGYILLQEPITKYDVVLFIFNFMGIILVTKPPFLFGINSVNQVESLNEFYGALLALFSLITLVIAIICSRKLAYRENSDPALMAVISGLTGVAIAGAVLSFTNEWALPSTGQDAFLLISVGIVSLLCNFFLVLGVQTESVVTIAVLETLSVPVAFLADVLVFEDIPDLVSILGAVTILVTTFAFLFKP